MLICKPKYLRLNTGVLEATHKNVFSFQFAGVTSIIKNKAPIETGEQTIVKKLYLEIFQTWVDWYLPIYFTADAIRKFLDPLISSTLIKELLS